MFARRKNRVVSLPVLGLFLLVLALANGPPARARPDRDPLAVHRQDTGSLLHLKMKAQRVLRRGSLAQFRQRTVDIGFDARDSLGHIAKSGFRNQDLFQRRLRSIRPASGILLRRPSSQVTTYEFEDSFLLVSYTSVTVVKPAELARVSPQFREFLGTKRRGRVDLSSLGPESLAGLNAFIKTELPLRPDDDPLKMAAKNGKVALLQAITDGKGLFETVEELVVPKRLPPMVGGVPQLPVLEKGVFNYRKFLPTTADRIRGAAERAARAHR
ncbi:MAG: hypothetical protein ACC662_11530, partial [Planctomycetota bacterium]